MSNGSWIATARVVTAALLWAAALATGDIRPSVISRTLMAGAITTTIAACTRRSCRCRGPAPGQRIISDHEWHEAEAMITRAVLAGRRDRPELRSVGGGGASS